jgi:two-component system NtrC family sensor kinase
VSLYAKVVLLLCTLFAAYGAVDYAVQRQVILPSFEALEADLARTDMDRARRAIERELDQLQTFSADWGNWLDTYQYMAGENPAFIEENMTPVTLEAAGLDAVAFLDTEGRFVWHKGLKPATREEIPYEFLAQAGLDARHPFAKAIREGNGAKGIVVTQHGPAMLVVAPVLDGAGNGPHRGAVLLARVITPEVAARLAEQAQVDLTVTTTPPSARGAAAERESLLQPRLVTLDYTNQVYRNLEDIFGDPSVMLRIDVPRKVSAQGRDAIGYALLSLFTAGVAVLVVLVVALRRMVLRPVSKLTQHAVRIAEDDDLSQRMNVRRADEIGVLAREFDRMVDKLADARRRLVDQSFEAGASQAASGVLHNIGNAMTPLSVTVATLQERLRSAPAGEIAMVLAEIESSEGDPARRADLEQFLRLASRELASVIASASDDVAVVTRQAQTINGALTQQLQSSRCGPVIETVGLPTLVEQSVELVSPELRQRITLDLDRSLYDAGPLPVPRITLQQVLQNLVQNAAEAAVSADGNRGHLHVSCVVERDGRSDEMLTLRFADDGVGIPDEALARIFEKGFSTKSRDTNQGIGLHWCANALNAIGGRIRAERGASGGAILYVTVPLQRSAATARAA